jgi:hypothetical protein
MNAPLILGPALEGWSLLAAVLWRFLAKCLELLRQREFQSLKGNFDAAERITTSPLGSGTHYLLIDELGMLDVRGAIQSVHFKR